MTILGYARVSTEGQTLEAQIEALHAAGAQKVFQEKASGAAKRRPQLARLLLELEPGDVLLVTRLDRLARSTLDLLTFLDAVNKAGAQFRSLADAWADTTSSHGRLILTVLGGLAEFERDLIRSRTMEGRRRAVAKGRKMGPKYRLTTDQRREALAAIASGEATQADLARRYNVHKSTISRLAQMGFPTV